jgi:hypothetical protein
MGEIMTRWILAAALPLVLASTAHAGEWSDYKRVSKPGTYTKTQSVNTKWQNGNSPGNPIANDQEARGFDTTQKPNILPGIPNKPAAKQSFDLGNSTHFDIGVGNNPNQNGTDPND